MHYRALQRDKISGVELSRVDFHAHLILSVAAKADLQWWIYRVSQKKRNGGVSVDCELKVLYIFISVDIASSAEENGTWIMKFG